MKCRHCQTPLQNLFLDLGAAPPSNSYLSAAQLNEPETYYPLRLFVCDHCWLVQTEDFVGADTMFSASYAYFSSTSKSWLAHARSYTRMVTERLALGSDSLVIEVASNDGYLLRNFVEASIPCLGIEPTESTAAAAEKLGVMSEREFFGEAYGFALAGSGRSADLIIGNNVYAHVPDINDFTRGLKAVLKPGGTITLEFPHLMRLISECQFDTVYHEHYSYLSLCTVQRIFHSAGLKLIDVEQLSTHGGSLRVWGAHAGDPRPEAPAVMRLLEAERSFGLENTTGYTRFQKRAERVKDGLVSFLLEQQKSGVRIAAYGAAAKGNTLLNFAGIRPDLLPCVYDAAAAKHGKFLPGSRIPILPPEDLVSGQIDTLLILPWNIADEIKEQLGGLDARFVIAVPEVRDV